LTKASGGDAYSKEAKNMFGAHMMKEIFGRGPGRGFGPRRGRVFEKGDLKYVILDLLKDNPSHGYEVIRTLEERSRGFYSPSPGSVYPILQLLEDLGYVIATQRDGKKVYAVTEEGRKFLEEHRRSVDDIWGRVGGGWDPEFVGEMHEIKHELGNLGRLFGRKMRAGRVDRDKLRRVREVVVRASREIEDILEERDDIGGTRA
jgi:DNA-binding PadR family transcriptional regulator